MGYTTEFQGQFDLDKPLSAEHLKYLQAFSWTRRMKRNAHMTAKMPDPIREAVGLPVGPEGAFFVGASRETFGQESTPDILDYNNPPHGQPGLWCKWVPTDDGLHIEWSGAEKFYNYVSWIEYLIVVFLEPWGYKVNGKVHWQGEESGDRGVIKVTNNEVKSAEDQVTNPLD